MSYDPNYDKQWLDYSAVYQNLGSRAGEEIQGFTEFIVWLVDSDDQLALNEIDLGDLHGYLEMYLEQQTPAPDATSGPPDSAPDDGSEGA